MRGLLVLPGWYVRRSSRDGVTVINPQEAKYTIAKQNRPKLTEKLVQQIVHQLDQRCRDVEPKAYAALESSN